MKQSILLREADVASVELTKQAPFCTVTMTDGSELIIPWTVVARIHDIFNKGMAECKAELLGNRTELFAEFFKAPNEHHLN